jgi:hypothetical protein
MRAGGGAVMPDVSSARLAVARADGTGQRLFTSGRAGGTPSAGPRGCCGEEPDYVDREYVNERDAVRAEAALCEILNRRFTTDMLNRAFLAFNSNPRVRARASSGE